MHKLYLFFIAIAGMFYTVVMAGAQGMPYGMSKLVGGIVFSTGLMLVVLCGAELFTSSTLLLMGKATGKLEFVTSLKTGDWFTLVTLSALCSLPC